MLKIKGIVYRFTEVIISETAAILMRIRPVDPTETFIHSIIIARDKGS